MLASGQTDGVHANGLMAALLRHPTTGAHLQHWAGTAPATGFVRGRGAWALLRPSLDDCRKMVDGIQLQGGTILVSLAACFRPHLGG